MFKAIRRIVRSIDLRSREVSRAVGLTIPQIVVLQAAQDLGQVTTRAISEASDLSAATVVTILDKLEAKGLVERYRSADDRRIVHTRVTERGQEVLGSAPPMLHDDFRERFAALPEDERRDLLSSMRRVADMMDTKGFDAASMLVVEEKLG
ncbi:MarR family winged helix-turn-helix transcriptional regulator [Breoghania sp.]|uniref:MarR family winged helix-turn-helix transcriptional regulator n=1 Tax=Breoghania sp. TaxID=2065378 RepID=UPI002AAA627B|nr:MarR family winged helix-turn-helix transcriptional regulator [Breoghania sp.]